MIKRIVMLFAALVVYPTLFLLRQCCGRSISPLGNVVSPLPTTASLPDPTSPLPNPSPELIRHEDPVEHTLNKKTSKNTENAVRLDPLKKLHKNEALTVLLFLNTNERLSCAAVNKEWKDLAEDRIHWKRINQRKWKIHPDPESNLTEYQYFRFRADILPGEIRSLHRRRLAFRESGREIGFHAGHLAVDGIMTLVPHLINQIPYIYSLDPKFSDYFLPILANTTFHLLFYEIARPIIKPEFTGVWAVAHLVFHFTREYSAPGIPLTPISLTGAVATSSGALLSSFAGKCLGEAGINRKVIILTGITLGVTPALLMGAGFMAITTSAIAGGILANRAAERTRYGPILPNERMDQYRVRLRYGRRYQEYPPIPIVAALGSVSHEHHLLPAFATFMMGWAYSQNSHETPFGRAIIDRCESFVESMFMPRSLLDRISRRCTIIFDLYFTYCCTG